MKSLFSEDDKDLALTGKQQQGATFDGSPKPVDCEIANIRSDSERRRIVDSNYMATEMICEKCSGGVLLIDIVN